MPAYNFKCWEDSGGCGCCFDKILSMSEISDYKPTCPDCKRRKTVTRDYTAESVMLTDGQCRTLGALAERNADQYSADSKNALREKHTEYLRNRPGRELPENMKYGVTLDRTQRRRDPKRSKGSE